jgi:hypothetical protein
MTQHDMNIANDTGAAVRSDINNALASLVSCSSGTSAPSTTFAYMLWADTTNNLLKQRNGANSAWITLGDLGETDLGHFDGTRAGSFTTLDTSGKATLASTLTGTGTTGSISSGVATTIFTATVGYYIVFASIVDLGAANYTAHAVVLDENTTTRVVADNGGALTITVSGRNVQVTQSSGGAQAVRWSYLKISYS